MNDIEQQTAQCVVQQNLLNKSGDAVRRHCQHDLATLLLILRLLRHGEGAMVLEKLILHDFSEDCVQTVLLQPTFYAWCIVFHRVIQQTDMYPSAGPDWSQA